jgi:hypothetical protein
MSDNVEVHKMTNKELINLANSEIEIFDRPAAQTSKDLIKALENSTPNTEIQEIITFYSALTINGHEAGLVRDAIVGALKKLVEPESGNG